MYAYYIIPAHAIFNFERTSIIFNRALRSFILLLKLITNARYICANIDYYIYIYILIY